MVAKRKQKFLDNEIPNKLLKRSHSSTLKQFAIGKSDTYNQIATKFTQDKPFLNQFDRKQNEKPEVKTMTTFTKDLEEDRGYLHSLLKSGVFYFGKGLDVTVNNLIDFIGSLSSWTSFASPLSFALSGIQTTLQGLHQYGETTLESLFSTHNNIVAPISNLVIGSCMGYFLGALGGQMIWPDWDTANQLYNILTLGFDFSYLGLLNIPFTTQITNLIVTKPVGTIADLLMLNFNNENIMSFLFRKSIYTIIGSVTMMGLIFKFVPLNQALKFYQLVSDYVAQNNPTLDKFLKWLLLPENIEQILNQKLPIQDLKSIATTVQNLATLNFVGGKEEQKTIPTITPQIDGNDTSKFLNTSLNFLQNQFPVLKTIEGDDTSKFVNTSLSFLQNQFPFFKKQVNNDFKNDIKNLENQNFLNTSIPLTDIQTVNPINLIEEQTINNNIPDIPNLIEEQTTDIQTDIKDINAQEKLKYNLSDTLNNMPIPESFINKEDSFNFKSIINFFTTLTNNFIHYLGKSPVGILGSMILGSIIITIVSWNGYKNILVEMNQQQI